MTEENFLYMHKGVVEHVISKGAFRKILGLLRVINFIRKQVRTPVMEALLDEIFD